jgi:hypothetical protein
MKRLLLIGFAACAFAVVPTLSASAMPRATPDTLVAGTDSAVILARGGHGHGRGHMGRGGRGTMVGRVGDIAVGTNPGYHILKEAASGDALFVLCPRSATSALAMNCMAAGRLNIFS